MNIWEHPRLDLLPDEALALKLMRHEHAAVLVQYMLENDFLGLDFQSVPPELQDAYNLYMEVHGMIGESPESSYN